jgi:hypothetical protein
LALLLDWFGWLPFKAIDTCRSVSLRKFEQSLLDEGLGFGAFLRLVVNVTDQRSDELPGLSVFCPVDTSVEVLVEQSWLNQGDGANDSCVDEMQIAHSVRVISYPLHKVL